MKKGVIIGIIVVGFLVVAILVGYFMSSIKEGEPLIKTGCDFRPTKDYGICEMLLGAYYDGEECVFVSGCSSKGDAIPFETLEECEEECEEPLVGGCGGVAPDQFQACCDNWANENGIFHIECVGEWEVLETECSWKCGTVEVEEFCGTNVGGICESDDDCVTGGCCGEICHDTSLSLAPCLRECEWKDCYNKSKYDMGCECVEGQCMWN